LEHVDVHVPDNQHNIVRLQLTFCFGTTHASTTRGLQLGVHGLVFNEAGRHNLVNARSEERTLWQTWAMLYKAHGGDHFLATYGPSSHWPGGRGKSFKGDRSPPSKLPALAYLPYPETPSRDSHGPAIDAVRAGRVGGHCVSEGCCRVL
jgi:hypothetical protein